MPKRIPSTIAIAANLADDIISRRIDVFDPENNYGPADENADPNLFVKLKQDIDEKIERMGEATDEDLEQGSLRYTLEVMSDSLERGLNAAFKLAHTLGKRSPCAQEPSSLESPAVRPNAQS